jgi:hypothetical protein
MREPADTLDIEVSDIMAAEVENHFGTAARRVTPRYSAVDEGSLYRAGQYAPAGTYREIDGARRTVVLYADDFLPASLDGRVACYERVATAADILADKRL